MSGGNWNRAAVVSNALNRRNLAMRSTAGFVKLLARPDGRLLGLRVVGPQAGTCIQGVALLIGQGGTLDAVERCVHPHPAVTEGVLEAARLLLGQRRVHFMVPKPPGLAGLIERHGFRPELVPVGRQGFQIDLPAADRPESPGAGFVLERPGAGRVICADEYA